MRLALFHFFLLLLTPLVLHAQSNYKPGLVVTLEGDTVRGFINYREWANTPDAVSFRVNANSGEEKEFTPLNSRYFEITGLEAYQRYEGSITMDPISIDRALHDSKTVLQPVVVFLKVALKGQLIDLLSYTDQIKTRFFFQEKDGGAPQELYYKVYYSLVDGVPMRRATGYLGPQLFLVTQKGYIGQLQFLANKYNVAAKGLNRQLESANYTEADLKNIFIKLNTTTTSEPQEKGSSSVRFYVGTGLNMSEVKLTGYDDFFEPDKNPVSLMPLLTLGFDAFLNKNIQRLYLRLEGAVTAANYRVDKEIRTEYRIKHNTYTISQQSFVVSPQLLYSLYNTDRFKFTIGGFARLNLSNYTRNNYQINQQDIYLNSPDKYTEIDERDYLKVMSFWPSFGLRAGAVVNKQYDIYASYVPYTAITQYIFTSIKVRSLQVGINYILIK